MNLVGISVSTHGKEMPQHYYLEWAKYFADREIYFYFTGGGDRKPAGFTQETAAKMKEIAPRELLRNLIR